MYCCHDEIGLVSEFGIINFYFSRKSRGWYQKKNKHLTLDMSRYGEHLLPFFSHLCKLISASHYFPTLLHNKSITYLLDKCEQSVKVYRPDGRVRYNN